MTQLITTEFAEPGARFAPDAFDSQIGKEVPFKIGDQEAGVCSLLGYSVAEDGSFATLTFEIPDVGLGRDLVGSFSIKEGR